MYFNVNSSLYLTKTHLHPASAQVFQPGWYVLQIIAALSVFQMNDIQKQNNISFISRNQLYPNCYTFFLTESQLTNLVKINNILIYPLPKDYNQNLKSLLADETGKCLVKATPKWAPSQSSIKFVQKSSDLYITFCRCSELQADDPQIRSFSPYKGRRIENRYNTGFMQSGFEYGVFEDGLFSSPHPIFNIGIRGENQIISITDTGVDIRHPFFYDPVFSSVPINHTISNHRKVAAYYNYANDITDGPNGHGTHCAGIALGESYVAESGLSLFNGMAPKAKLYVVDIGRSGTDLSGEFNAEQLYDLMVKDDCFIASNSWGLDPGNNRPDSVMYDYIAYENPNLLFTFAGGNEGPGYYTINSPGDSKNVLSIGGVTRSRMADIHGRSWAKWTLDRENKKSVVDFCTFGADPSKTTTSNPMKTMANLPVRNYKKGEDLTGCILVYDDSVGNSWQTFCEDVKDSITKGAAVILHSNASNICSYLSAPTFTYTGSIEASGKASIYEYLGPITSDTVRVASFSSVGPSPIGGEKPDVVVSGYAYSACAGRSAPTLDSLSHKQGTSMATPAAAGLLALIRQYFTDGYYPTQKETTTPRDSFIPTSSLLRAAFINSAAPKFSPGSYGPNIKSGFGLPNISAVLLDPLRIVKDAKIKPKGKHTYLFQMTNSKLSLRITMAYLDPPLSDLSIIPLYADLDLYVVSPSGKKYRGNGKPDSQADMGNTIERVIIEQPYVEIGDYTVVITSTDFSENGISEIHYSLVVNGPFDNLDFLTNPIDPISEINSPLCEFGCSNGGKCSTSEDSGSGTCVCDDYHFGFSCDSSITELQKDVDHALRVNPSKVEFAMVPIGKTNKENKVKLTARFSGTDSSATAFVYLSNRKFDSLSDPGIIAAGLRNQQSYASNLTLSNDKELLDTIIFVAIKAISYQTLNFNIQISSDSVYIKPKTPTPLPTPSKSFTPTAPPSPKPSASIPPPSASSSPLTSSSDSSLPSMPSLYSAGPSNTDIHSSSQPVPTQTKPTEIDTSLESEADLISNEEKSDSLPKTDEIFTTQTANDNNDSNNTKNARSRLNTLDFLTVFMFAASIMLIAILLIFGTIFYMNYKHKAEIDEMYRRKEEPKLDFQI